MANERLIETFMRELMREFILLCHGNDFEKLTLLKIGDTVERLYEKHGGVDAVPVVRCGNCKHFREPFCCRRDDETHRERINMLTVDFCSYGERSIDGK